MYFSTQFLDFLTIFSHFCCLSFQWPHRCVGHPAWAPEGREGRSQAGPKGHQLEVGARRAPKVLECIYFIWSSVNNNYGFILVKLGNLFHMKAKHVRYGNLSVHLGTEPWTVHPAFTLFWHFTAVLGNTVIAWSTKPGCKQLLVFIGQT